MAILSIGSYVIAVTTSSSEKKAEADGRRQVMKLVNTKDLRRLLDEGALEYEDLFDAKHELAGPCRQVHVDKEQGDIVLLLDRCELMRQSLKKLGLSDGVPIEFFERVMRLWREDNIDDVKKELKLKASKRRTS